MFVQSINRAAQICSNHPATICEDRIRSWRESRDRSARLAEALRTMGIRPGDRIGILGVNSDYYLEVMHATWWCGAVTVPMNTRWAVAEHIYNIDDAEMSAIFVDDIHLGVLSQIQAQRAIGSVISNGE